MFRLMEQEVLYKTSLSAGNSLPSKQKYLWRIAISH